MNRDDHEMALWTAEYVAARAVAAASAACAADEAVAQFRKRYPPPQTQTPPAVWYDEPPLPKDGTDHHCWVEGFDALQFVYWSDQYSEWRRFEGASQPQPLAGRRVSPIAKPPEPTT